MLMPKSVEMQRIKLRIIEVILRVTQNVYIDALKAMI
jgi:hypothetical protein